MILLVGLGNPGGRYARNRHNIGFMALDRIASRQGFGPWRSRFQGLTSEGSLGGVKTMLLKPETFMNLSGQSVAEAARFLRIDLSDIAVLHDELDVAPAKVRLKIGGGNAGHNGLRSITAHMGNDYKRVRLGIGHPGDKNMVSSYVLNDFAKSEEDWVDCMIDAIADNAPSLARGEDSRFQNAIHLALEAKGFTSPKRPGERDTE